MSYFLIFFIAVFPFLEIYSQDKHCPLYFDSYWTEYYNGYNGIRIELKRQSLEYSVQYVDVQIHNESSKGGILYFEIIAKKENGLEEKNKLMAISTPGRIENTQTGFICKNVKTKDPCNAIQSLYVTIDSIHFLHDDDVKRTDSINSIYDTAKEEKEREIKEKQEFEQNEINRYYESTQQAFSDIFNILRNANYSDARHSWFQYKLESDYEEFISNKELKFSIEYRSYDEEIYKIKQYIYVNFNEIGNVYVDDVVKEDFYTHKKVYQVRLFTANSDSTIKIIEYEMNKSKRSYSMSSVTFYLDEFDSLNFYKAITYLNQKY